MARIVILDSFDRELINFRGALIKTLLDEGHQLFACAPDLSVEVKTILTNMGAECHEVTLSRTGMNPAHDMRTVIQLMLLFKKLKPDIFFGCTIKPVIYGSIAARLANIPKILSIIEGLGYAFSGMGIKSRLIGFIASQLYRSGLRFNHHVLFLNTDNLNIFIDKKLVTQQQASILNGIGLDIDHFSLAPYPEKISFLMIARLLKDKGIYEYLEAAHKLKKRYKNIHFRLVGDFDDNPTAITQQELQPYIDSGSIEYLGYHQDVRPAIIDSSIYVLPSYHEGRPRTVMEALAMGRAVITTDAPGCKESIINDVNGYIVPVRNITALTQAMEKFIQQPELISIMGLAGREFAENEYDANKINQTIMKFMGVKK